MLRLQEVIAALSSAHTPEQVAELACRIGSEAMGARSGALWILDDDGPSLRLAGSWGMPSSFIDRSRVIRPGDDAPALEAVQRGEPLWVESLEPSAGATPTTCERAQPDAGLGSFGAVPLVIEGKRLGVILFAHAVGHVYDPGERAFYQALAQHCAHALDRARLLEAERRSNERLQVLARAGEVLSASLDEGATLRAVARLAVPDLADVCTVSVVEGRAFRCIASEHVTSEPGADSAPAGSRRPLRSGLPSLIEVPLVAEGKRIGVLSFEMASSGRVYERADRHLAEEIARRVGLAVSNARLYTREQRARERMAQLQELTSALARAATTADVARVATEGGLKPLGCATSAIYRLGGNVLRLVDQRGAPEDYMRAFGDIPVTNASPAGRAVLERSAIFIEDEDRFGSAFPEIAGTARAAGRASAFACVPMIVHDRVVGTVAYGYEGAHTFTAEERALAMTVADHCAQAFDRARLLEAAQGAARRAEEANRIKDEFLATVSHELRTPLNAIIGYAAMLLRENAGVPPAAHKALLAIHRNAQTQTRIIDDILDVSRIITGKLRIEPQPVSMDAIVADAIDVIRPSALAKEIGVVYEPRSEPRTLLGDPERLKQAVWNLLSNAIKFTDPGGAVRVSIEQSGTAIVVEVADTGKGIAPEFLPFVFERFRQADSSTTRTFGGLGLGLAIVRHIVELHGGQVFAESRGPGLGATFRIALPIRAVVARPAPEQHAREEAKGDTREAPRAFDLSRVRVLVVDDEPDARELLASVLGVEGADVEVAGSAAAALAALSRFRPHVVVSDIGMPGEDGYALIQRIRQLPAEDGGMLPAIALTAYARAADRERAISAGFNLHVSKPVEPDVLCSLVAKLAQRAPDGGSAATAL